MVPTFFPVFGYPVIALNPATIESFNMEGVPEKIYSHIAGATEADILFLAAIPRSSIFTTPTMIADGLDFLNDILCVCRHLVSLRRRH